MKPTKLPPENKRAFKPDITKRLPRAVLCSIEGHQICLTSTNKIYLTYPDGKTSDPYLDRTNGLMGVNDVLPEAVAGKLRQALENARKAREARRQDEQRDVPFWMREEAFE